MRTFLFSLFLCAALHAQSPDLKRNVKLQRLSLEASQAQARMAAEIRSWTADCEAKGLVLQQVGPNLLDCVAKPVQPAQAQRPVPKPDAKEVPKP